MKKYLKIIITVCFLLGLSYYKAQTNKDKVAELRVAFISKKVELTPSEAEKFWPVYNEYNDKVRAIKKNLRRSYKKNLNTLSTTEAEELYQLDIKSKQAETELHTLYFAKLKDIIGANKIVKLRAAEEIFKLEVIKNIKDKNE